MSVSDNITQIQELFQTARKHVEDFGVTSDFFNEQGDYPSIPFEAASTVLAIQSINSNDSTYTSWKAFSNKHENEHGSQLYVGLGWAMSETNQLDTSYLETLPSKWRWRVLDGYGYYAGLFKRRNSIRSQQIPSCILHEEDTYAFDQGLGRSLWYLSQGDPQRLQRFIELFPDNRKKHLWRGIGLAMEYVGGITTENLNRISELAQPDNLPTFKSGVLQAIFSKEKVNSQTPNKSVTKHFIDSGTEVLRKWNTDDYTTYYNYLCAVEANL